MWGNAKGWVVSAVIVVLVGVLIFYFGRAPQISAPTGKLPLGLAAVKLSKDPATLDVKPGANECDAGDLYREVIADWKTRSHIADDKKYASTTVLAADEPEMVKKVVRAADCAKCTLFSRKPAQVVNYDNQQDDIEALRVAGTYTYQIGHYHVVKGKQDKAEYDKAEPYLRGAYILGQRLYDERLRFTEFNVGVNLMSSAIQSWGREAGDKKDDARVAQLNEVNDAINDYQKHVPVLLQAITGMGSGKEGETIPNAGDIFDFALNSKEPMWQTESILKLGRMRWMFNVTPGDQRGADRILKQMAVRADLAPGPKAAAVAARDLDRDTFAKIGGGS